MEEAMRGAFRFGFLILAAAFFGGAAMADAPKAKEPGVVEWHVGDGVFLAGRDLTVDRKVGGSLTVTGETIGVTRDASV